MRFSSSLPSYFHNLLSFLHSYWTPDVAIPKPLFPDHYMRCLEYEIFAGVCNNGKGVNFSSIEVNEPGRCLYTTFTVTPSGDMFQSCLRCWIPTHILFKSLSLKCEQNERYYPPIPLSFSVRRSFHCKRKPCPWWEYLGVSSQGSKGPLGAETRFLVLGNYCEN